MVGSGLVGLATAMALAARRGPRVVVLEAEGHVAAHQSGHNSGVIHSGLYYRPGSLKATLCVRGRQALYAFCAAEGVPHERCGKLVVATAPAELPALDELLRRGQANGLQGVRLLADQAALREVEPHAGGLAALWVPETGIADFPAVARAYARRIESHGGRVLTGARLLVARPDGDALALETAHGPMRCALLVNCAGLQADRVARLCGLRPATRIIPFRGEYWDLSAAAARRVRALIYPVPDPRFPFLGVHLTRGTDGRVEAGPNAVVAWKREGYLRASFSPRDAWDLLTFPGFWRFAARHWRTGLRETWRSVRPALLARDLRRLLPTLTRADLRRGPTGVRAQEIDPQGRLVDDFHIVPHGRALHVLNAPSPAATASLAIGEHIAAEALAALEDSASQPLTPHGAGQAPAAR